jgi:hypothetical protein
MASLKHLHQKKMTKNNLKCKTKNDGKLKTMVAKKKFNNHGKKTRLGRWVEFKIQKKSNHKEKEKLN